MTGTAQRKEIQALRAIAVMAVIAYHVWPDRVRGGYVGVDVFFVISGFLIIGHLVREVERTGRIALLQFWARRVRRLLPAALLVLAATTVAVIVVVPRVWWPQFLTEIGASASYVLNWVLAANAVDYLGADNSPSPAQHYWSLSVEEQFYVVFPLLIIVALVVGRALRAAVSRTIAVLLGLVVAVSFVYSAVAVAAGDPAAYFVTHSRAWQFALGGVLALVAHRASASPAVKAAASWLGLLLIVACVALFDNQTPFPGTWALVPTLATAVVIWAGMPAVAWAPTRALALRPVQVLGDISYSAYLWHWPPLVILPIVLRRELGTVEGLGVVVATLGAAWLTKRFVEEPFRNGRLVVRRMPRASVAALLAVSLVLTAGCLVVATRAGDDARARAAAIATAVSSGDPCIGAPAALNDCDRPFATNTLTDPELAAQDIGRGVRVQDDCKQTMDDDEIITCDVGDLSAPTAIALVGDSHAGHFLEALDAYGLDHGVRFVTYLKTWCAGTGAAGVAAHDSTIAGIESCASWGAAVVEKLAADPSIDAIVYSTYAAAYIGNADSPTTRGITAADYEAAWSTLEDAGKQVIALRDIPTMAQGAPECVASHLDTYDPCTTPQSTASLGATEDPMLIAAAATEGVTVVDLSDVFCSDGQCHSLIGGLVVYFGTHHMTASFARTLAPIVGERIVAAIV